ncbi:hypothetical protein [Nocardia sp. NPDC051750]|uniref:hypothetical protein n=1 Tax=Nocardia sp. NPDC051750 TaxID=3364325 RepID=UPI003794517D
MRELRDSIRDLVNRSVEQAGESAHATVVVTTEAGIVQWLATSEGVFHLEVADPALPRRGPLARLLRRRRGETGGQPFTDRQLGLLTDSGFAAGEPNYELRPDESGIDNDHIVHIIVTVLHDILGIRDANAISAEVF